MRRSGAWFVRRAFAIILAPFATVGTFRVKIAYLPLENLPRFYGEADESVNAPTKSRGWLERSWLRLYERLTRAESVSSGFLKSVETALKRFDGPEAAFQRSLRLCDNVTLAHAHMFRGEQVQAEWKRYLARARLGKTAWIAVYALLSPVSILLAPLPGPNIIGYWFVYQLACSAMAYSGLYRVSRKSFPTHAECYPALDNLQLSDDGLKQLFEVLGWKDLQALEKMTKRRKTKRPADENAGGSRPKYSNL
jgi:hypothetical protein